MADYRDYVSFEVPEFMKQILQYSDKYTEADAVVPPSEQAKMAIAFQEMVNTPEGRELLESTLDNIQYVQWALEDPPTEKIHVVYNKDGWSGSSEHFGFLIGSKDAELTYQGAQDDVHHDFSLQRLITHELYHAQNSHFIPRGDENEKGASPSKEAEAIDFTNEYMDKHYDEPARAEDHDAVKHAGSPEWDFNPTRLAASLEAMGPEKAAAMGPEVQAAYEVRSNRELLSETLDTVFFDNPEPQNTEMLLQITADYPPEPAPDMAPDMTSEPTPENTSDAELNTDKPAPPSGP